jgi:hypothetical protein
VDISVFFDLTFPRAGDLSIDSFAKMEAEAQGQEWEDLTPEEQEELREATRDGEGRLKLLGALCVADVP